MRADADYLRKWVGRTETRTDEITRVPITALAATLDRADTGSQAGDPLPPLWHWLYFLPVHLQSEIDDDGHPRRGGFLPPVPLPRRMWAGGRLQFLRPLQVGGIISRVSEIIDVSDKEGRTGSLVFVRVRHRISDDGGLALEEEQDIVYRDKSQPDAPAAVRQAAPADHQWTREVRPDEVLLFRYSALTFNGHRIHYDRRYATEVEGYPGLVVHGPLIATLLLELLRHNMPGSRVAAFSFRALRPLFDVAPFSLCGRLESDSKTARLWARAPDGGLAMEATAGLV